MNTPATTPTTNTPKTEPGGTCYVTMTKVKDCVHSVRFQTEDPKARVKDVYVSRAMPGIEDAKTVKVTVEIVN